MSNTKRKTKEEFIKDAILIHGNKYDYSKVEYINQLTKICIICPEHGEFWQRPKSHLNKHGCRLCGDEKSRNVNTGKSHKDYRPKEILNTSSFIKKAIDIHGDKYDYSKVNFISLIKPVCIICPEHGEFWQRPLEHIKQKSGCPVCANKKRYDRFVMKQNDFVKKAMQVFNGKYTYDNVNYINNHTKVSITCPKHGDFLCTPQNHLKGRGCPICKSEIYVYENRLYGLLLTIFKENEIIRQFKPEWLSNNKSIDFYIPKYKIAIEHQGSQHFKPISYLGGDEKFYRTQILDKEKYDECIENGVTLLYFMYEKYIDTKDFFAKVYNDEISFKNKIYKLINYE